MTTTPREVPQLNLYPLIAQLSIQHRDTGIVEPFVPNWAQREFLDEFHRQWNSGVPVRIITNKARQLGISTMTEAIGFLLCFLYNDLAALVVAHDAESSEHILSMSNRYWETYPYRSLYTTKYAGRKHLQWVETGSSIRILTAGNKAGGRSRTIRFLHGSEVAFWPDADDVMLGLRQTIPSTHGTVIILESTANGVGNLFYNAWNNAVSGDSEFVPMFFPWWKHPEYAASYVGVNPEITDQLDVEEKALRKLGVDDDHLAWRRWGIKNLAGYDLSRFHQEYPSTPEEAFISTGSNVFPVKKLAACYERQDPIPGRLARDSSESSGVRFQPDIAGPLKIYKMPAEDADWGVYFVGGDPTGTTRGDMACAQVINRRTYEQVAVYRGRIDPMSFAEELYKIGLFYNRSSLSAEATGPGYSTIGRLVEMEYPSLWFDRRADRAPGAIASNYGWNTTFKSKEWAIGHLLKLIVDEDLLIHDPDTFVELRDYVTLEAGGYGPASREGHDDTVMALAIAAICSATEIPVSPYGNDGELLVLPDNGHNRKPFSIDEAMDPDFWAGQQMGA